MTRSRVLVVAAGVAAGVFCGAMAAAAGAVASPHTAARARAAPPASAAARYLAIANAGNRRLDAALDPLETRDHDNLARAAADLRSAATTERWFDRRLLEIHFPPAAQPVALRLYRSNEARAMLTAAAAASTSLPQLHTFEAQIDGANATVQRAVRELRHRLGLPPPPVD